MALFAIQVPAVFSLALQLFHRLTQAVRLALDDYLVIVLTPVFIAFLVVGQYGKVCHDLAASFFPSLSFFFGYNCI